MNIKYLRRVQLGIEWLFFFIRYFPAILWTARIADRLIPCLCHTFIPGAIDNSDVWFSRWVTGV